MADPVERHASRNLLLALALLAVVLALVLVRREPPEPRPADAPAAEFSGGRAREVLRDLLGDGRPHPTGSVANARIRDGIAARLRSLGYEPRVQQGFTCNDFSGECGRVENVVARLEGSRRDGAVLLMAHYDSVPAGPGAGDDMAGVAAVLEIARALKGGPPPRNPVIFLLEDAEEAGLLGAKLFAGSPLAAEVRAVVNLEARGTSGPSLMFESIGDDAGAVARFGARAPRPVTSSVFAAIYELLPNDTDLTLFKTRGVPGLNFAFTGGPAHYHSPRDNFENVSPQSLQHHGDNALAAVQGLAAADLTRPAAGDAVFFDLFGLTVLSWPEGWSLGLALLALALVVAAVALGLRRGLTGGGVGLGLLVFLAAAGLSAAVAYALATLARAITPGPWMADPLALVAAFWLLPLAVVGLSSASLGRRAGFHGIWAGVWLAWSLLGLALVLAGLPKFSYLFLVPALLAGAAGLVSRGPAAALLPALAAGALWFPVLIPLYGGLGAGALLPVAVLVAILLSGIAPFFAAAPGRLAKGTAAAAGVLALALFGWAAATPPFSAESPQPVTVSFHQDADRGQARFILESPAAPAPPAMLQAAPFAQRREPPYPWSPQWWLARIAPAPALPVSAPELAVLEEAPGDGKRRLRLRLTSPRGASTAFVFIPKSARVESVKVDGYAMAGQGTLGVFGWYRVIYRTLPPEGAELTVVLSETAPQDWYVADTSPGLPPAGEALLKARGPAAVPIQDGDLTLVSRKVRI